TLPYSRTRCLLSAPTLGGRAGSEILAKRPQSRGTRMKADLKTYARMLVEAGLVLGVCDYGYCVYRQEYSACRGNSAGPNPVLREPSTCARCLNFTVTAQHRPYWLEQMSRCQQLLSEPALPGQTLKIVRERQQEARTMLRSIDTPDQENDHGSTISAILHPDKAPAPATPRSGRRKLHAALAMLQQQNAARPIVLNATVTELCRRAGVSRNALYRYYPNVLHDLRKLQCRALRAARSRRTGTDQRTENALLIRQISSLVALVDHYYTACRESSALLERREREL